MHCPVSTGVPLVAPLPFRGMLCGLPLMLSVTESVPASVPVVPGEKVMLMGQLAAGASVAVQVSFATKFDVAAIPPMFSAASP